jgi:hypothetical protein
MHRAIRRYGGFGLVFLGGMLTGAGVSHLGKDAPGAPRVHQPVAPGSTMFSVLDDEVMSLTYSTASSTLTAQRSKPGAPLAVQITYADGRMAQQCLASPGLAGQLAHFSTLTANRQLSAQQVEADFPALLGTIEIRDRILAEPPAPMAFRANRDRTAVGVAYQGHAAEVKVPAAAFAALDAGCAALKQSPAGPP